jgi:GWxTD domain-containing protein
MAGVAIFYLRSAGGWIAVRRLRHAGVRPPSAEWQERFTTLCTRAGVTRTVALIESCVTEVPVVIGYLRPVILLPASLAIGLSTEQVEALLLHELAHIRRHDYLVNLLQSAVEGLLFYHPAVWWVSHVIRTEREHCCDDAVVALRGDARGYARALAALESMRAPDGVLAASGGSLVKRVRRLLRQPESPQGSPASTLAAFVLLIGAATMLSAWQQQPPSPPRPAIHVPAPRVVFAQAQTKQGEVRRPRQASLDNPYHKWLTEDVAYIITNEERAEFAVLQSPAEYERFIEQFWKRRDPTPGTDENEFKEEHYRRIAYSNEHYADPNGLPGWKTDRGRIYITYGPPDEKETHPDSEQWLYRHIEGIGENVVVEFDSTGRLIPVHHIPMLNRPPARAMSPMFTGPFPDHLASNGAAVFVGRGGTQVAVLDRQATVDVQLAKDAIEDFFAKITTAARRTVTAFEDVVTGGRATKQVKLMPGTYRVNIVHRNRTTGETTVDEVQILVK